MGHNPVYTSNAVQAIFDFVERTKFYDKLVRHCCRCGRGLTQLDKHIELGIPTLYSRRRLQWHVTHRQTDRKRVTAERSTVLLISVLMPIAILYRRYICPGQSILPINLHFCRKSQESLEPKYRMFK